MSHWKLDRSLIDSELIPMDLRVVKRFPAANWYSPGGKSAAALRLREPGAVRLELRPKFKIQPNAKVFSIGSCFARNVESALLARGVRVLSTEVAGIKPEWFARPSSDVNGFLNKYNTHSMLSELVVALEQRTNEAAGLIELDDGTWYSPLTHNIRTLPKGDAMTLRRVMSSVYARIAECELVIVTFGLNEVWVDQKTGIFLNGAPLPTLMKRYPGRFAFFTAGPQASLEVARRMVRKMRDVAGSALKVLVTVSPVPMGRTFMSRDVIVSNTYSKSTLRVMAQELAEEDPFVDYFPSYEIATMSNPADVWQEDRAHVRKEMVSQIVATFCGNYIDT